MSSFPSNGKPAVPGSACADAGRDDVPRGAFEDLARLAATLCGTPAALLCLPAQPRPVVVADAGVPPEVMAGARELCERIPRPVDGQPRVIDDLLLDRRYADDARRSGLRFHACAPLQDRDGQTFGMLSVVDTQPRMLGERQRDGLATLARQAGYLYELHRYTGEQRRLLDEREAFARRLEHDRADLQRRHDDLARTAAHDPLTGLFNRAALGSLLDDPDGPQLHGAAYVLVLVDIDHFKQVNDRYGHLLGDRALRAVADAINASIREGDFAVRYGGEEFLVVLPDTRLDAGFDVAERIRLRVMAVTLPFPLTASIGIAAGHPGQDTAQAVFDRADQALYRAKTAGRNRIVADDTPR
jgi:diguanylate cyclase (GGDEF)-like protein